MLYYRPNLEQGLEAQRKLEPKWVSTVPPLGCPKFKVLITSGRGPVALPPPMWPQAVGLKCVAPLWRNVDACSPRNCSPEMISALLQEVLSFLLEAEAGVRFSQFSLAEV